MRERSQWGRFIFGIIVIFIGLGALFDRLDTWDFGSFISDWWPAILIIVGVVQLSRRSVSVFGGGILILAGIFFLGKRMDFLPFEITAAVFWPVVIILVGLWIIFGSRHHLQQHFSKPIDTNEKLNYSAIFSGIETRNGSKEFQGGTVTAIFGGAEIDLRDAEMLGKEAFLEITAVFGGVNIKVPEDWKVEIYGTPLFGGFDNKTRYRGTGGSEEMQLLKIRCFAMFGGAEIKN